MNEFELPKQGVFGIDISKTLMTYYEVVFDGNSGKHIKKELKSTLKESLMKPLNFLSNIPFPKYLLNMLNEGNLSSYLDCLGMVEKTEFEKEKEKAKTCGMLVFVPLKQNNESVGISIIATRSEDISYLRTGINYMKLGMEPLEIKTNQKSPTKSFAMQVYEISRGSLPLIFGVKDGLSILDFFIPSNNEYHTFAFDRRKTQEILSAKRKPETNYKKCLADLLNEKLYK